MKNFSEITISNAVKKGGDRLRKIRESRQLSCNDLAIKLGKSRATVNAWENGTRTIGNHDLIKLSVVLQINPSYILMLSNRIPLKAVDYNVFINSSSENGSSVE